MKDPAPGGPLPFVGFRVETERKADGRRIHYYTWPADPVEPSAGAAPDDDAPHQPAPQPHEPGPDV